MRGEKRPVPAVGHTAQVSIPAIGTHISAMEPKNVASIILISQYFGKCYFSPINKSYTEICRGGSFLFHHDIL
jgi:hypothetical protein